MLMSLFGNLNLYSTYLHGFLGVGSFEDVKALIFVTALSALPQNTVVCTSREAMAWAAWMLVHPT